ncbi:tRNA (guanosine(37)-N1)-methyltransferase TrmD [Desulfurivibrio dismutans]|uniref:tRNA (guanosine(37)-N1)-methyltransferase TrmD n=1 Tax=Desulfurivibrio dismutans TaxID=1398908 RepID=UPI0023DC2ADE|nr:tRNA (guanosine(37)-N1)-methyltransferase TrmD [Desulfurivibrio alkaliphilus]MDF1614681.1 tRNA (guanosine(37)-N1)-methyltransferase TrmD [Desulfurivibrio alkaliphilus]
MRFDILTIFPEFFDSPLACGMLRRAIQDGLVRVGRHDIREFTVDKHAMTDDRPFGGGEGMVMKPEPLAAAVHHVRGESGAAKVVLLSPQGRTLNQELATELAGEEQLILVCGRYEGVDERFRLAYVDCEVSVGDYILTGGEPAALALLDCVVRLLPGVLGCGDSAANDTFSLGSRGGLKYPQYTRPRNFEGMEVPEVLLSGDHATIARWRLVEAVRRTRQRRPDLLKAADFTPAERRLLAKEGIDLA